MYLLGLGSPCLLLRPAEWRPPSPLRFLGAGGLAARGNVVILWSTLLRRVLRDVPGSEA